MFIVAGFGAFFAVLLLIVLLILIAIMCYVRSKHRPQRSISPSDQGDGHLYNPTEFIQVPSSQKIAPSHRSHSSINHSHNLSGSRCTCNCHDRNSDGSAGHLKPPKTLPLARYGYPNADNYHHPHHHHHQYSAATPVSGDVADTIAIYLKHKDCPNQENCQTCQLINCQFQHILTRYEHAHNKDLNYDMNYSV